MVCPRPQTGQDQGISLKFSAKSLLLLVWAFQLVRKLQECEAHEIYSFCERRRLSSQCANFPGR